MKSLHTLIVIGLFSMSIISGCKKDDKPAVKECQVEQFESKRLFYYNGANQEIPYLFKKAFDANGRVVSIDAYVASASPGTHVQANLQYKNQMVYLLDQTSTDTIMIMWLNNAGRVIRAEEKSGFKYNGSSPEMSYEFSYNPDNKLQQYIATTNRYPGYPQNYIAPIEYDVNGNCTRNSNNSYKYDLTRSAKKQFYYDSEFWGNYWLGVKMMEYLNYFPEITSPLNIRTYTQAGREEEYVLARTPLTDHQFDAEGKLISYKANGQLIPVYWNCGTTSPKQ